MARFLVTQEGDVKLLRDSDPREYRLRVGDYRVRFQDLGDTIQILSSGTAAKRIADRVRTYFDTTVITVP
jgi:hypothetical protein